MAIIATAGSGGGNFTPAPAGTHAAICVDVIDLGILEVTFGKQTKSQHKIRVVWQLDELRDDGKQYQVSKRYTLSLHEKAGLRKDLESWRGRPFTADELRGFDVETVISVPALLNVVHAPSPDGSKVYANIVALMRLPKGMQAPTMQDYVRACDREPAIPEAPPPSHEYGDYQMDDLDSQVPF